MQIDGQFTVNLRKIWYTDIEQINFVTCIYEYEQRWLIAFA